MSFDVTVGTKEFNYTSNMGAFFTDFGVHPRVDLNGRTPEHEALRISDAFSAMTDFDMEALGLQYNDPGGWGDVEGATRFLFEIFMACITETDVDTVEAS